MLKKLPDAFFNDANLKQASALLAKSRAKKTGHVVVRHSRIPEMSAAGLQHGTFEVFGFGAGTQNRMVVGLTADF